MRIQTPFLRKEKHADFLVRRAAVAAAGFMSVLAIGKPLKEGVIVLKPKRPERFLFTGSVSGSGVDESSFLRMEWRLKLTLSSAACLQAFGWRCRLTDPDGKIDRCLRAYLARLMLEKKCLAADYDHACRFVIDDQIGVLVRFFLLNRPLVEEAADWLARSGKLACRTFQYALSTDAFLYPKQFWRCQMPETRWRADLSGKRRDNVYPLFANRLSATSPP